MIPALDKRRILSVAIAVAAAAAAFWAYASQPRLGTRGTAVVPVQDGKTIDFSGGRPVIRDSAADKAAMDAAVKEMDEASKSVTFPAGSPPKK